MLLYQRRIIMVTTMVAMIMAIIISTTASFSFEITLKTTVVHRSPPPSPRYSPISSGCIAIPTHQLFVTRRPASFDDTVISSSSNDNNNNNSGNTNCCVIHSLQFPSVAWEISERLSLPLITIDASVDTAVLQEGDTTQHPPKKYQHAIVIEPYTYENSIQNYSIGIVSLHDPSNNNNNNSNNIKNRKPTTRMKMNPYIIDFLPPQHSRLGRRTSGDSGGQPDLLLKAFRLPPNYYSRNNNMDDADRTKQQPQPQPITIYDVTAGFGQDSLLIAHSMIKNKSTLNTIGRVHMIERNTIIATLIHDALRRLQLIASFATENKNDDYSTGSMIAQQLCQCLSMECDDGLNVLRKINSTTSTTTITCEKDNSLTLPDIVYFDPMFPERKKSASVKKNMQILHSLLHETHGTSSNAENTNGSNHENDCSDMIDTNRKLSKDEAESMLLQMAYEVARYRVVVKRPIHAPSIPFSSATWLNRTVATAIATNKIKPSYQIMGTINRWDVYNKH